MDDDLLLQLLAGNRQLTDEQQAALRLRTQLGAAITRLQREIEQLEASTDREQNASTLVGAVLGMLSGVTAPIAPTTSAILGVLAAASGGYAASRWLGRGSRIKAAKANIERLARWRDAVTNALVLSIQTGGKIVLPEAPA